MRKFKKIVFRIALCLLVFWVFTPMLFNLIGFEFADAHFERSFEDIRFFGVPVCILTTLIGTIKTTDHANRILLKILLTTGASIFSSFVLIVATWSNLCGWTNRETLYINQQNEKIRIVKRVYGCGMLTSGLPPEKNFKIREVTSYFVIVSEIDIKHIDETSWKKYEE